MFELRVNTDGEAFDCGYGELARILGEVAERVQRGEIEGALRDVNGNHVGDFKYVNTLTGT